MNIRKLFAVLAVMFVLPLQAFAFGHSAPMDTKEGRPLKVLMHDQIPVMSANYAAIMDLGDELLANPAITGETRAELSDYMNSAKGWHYKSLGGWVPGTVTSDLNPWHKTYHGSLRATFHVMMIAKAHDALIPTAGKLYYRLNDEMYGRLEVCANTYDNITTSSDIRPDWSRLNPLMTPLLALLALLSAVAIIGLSLLRRPLPKPTF